MNTSNPFFVEGPACIHFSGGRTSAYMTTRILAAHGGQLPPNVHIAFANTGREREETLRFVKRCEEAWQTKVHWIEWRPPRRDQRAIDAATEVAVAARTVGRATRTWQLQRVVALLREATGFAEVDFGNAHREGEPFEAMIFKERYMPNPAKRLCTKHLKIKTAMRFMYSLGYKRWTSIVDLRADEPRRLANLAARGDAPPKRRGEVEKCAPLGVAGVTADDVLAYWRGAPFDLELPPGDSNCDLCFLKSTDTRVATIAAVPGCAQWWVDVEAHRDMAFRNATPAYAKLVQLATAKRCLPPTEDGLGDCTCTD